MRAIAYDRFGGADVLHLADVPKPDPRPGDLLIRAVAARVNRAELPQRVGYQGDQTYGERPLPRLQLAVEVIAVGSDVTDVTDVAPGDRVMAVGGGGAYAEYARADHHGHRIDRGGVDAAKAGARAWLASTPGMHHAVRGLGSGRIVMPEPGRLGAQVLSHLGGGAANGVPESFIEWLAAEWPSAGVHPASAFTRVIPSIGSFSASAQSWSGAVSSLPGLMGPVRR
ncbi:MAG: hypothetical protein CML68_11555 [Rhodobacteraceae bacterium]|nr:hypothetical protein [Paracoccaceae bacterium]